MEEVVVQIVYLNVNILNPLPPYNSTKSPTLAVRLSNKVKSLSYSVPHFIHPSFGAHNKVNSRLAYIFIVYIPLREYNIYNTKRPRIPKGRLRNWHSEIIMANRIYYYHNII